MAIRETRTMDTVWTPPIINSLLNGETESAYLSPHLIHAKTCMRSRFHDPDISFPPFDYGCRQYTFLIFGR